MKKLINISKTNIGNSEVNAVSARDLYLGLGLAPQHWAVWCATNIEKNEFFSQGVDFIQLPTMGSANTPNPPKDYAISIDFAKHVSMMAKTQKGHEYRNYFLELENKPQRTKQLPVQEFKGLLAVAKMFGLKGNQALLSANKATKKNTGVDFQALLGIELEAPVQSRLINASDVGLLINLSGIKVNQLLKEKGFQVDHRDSKNRIVWTPTEKGLNFSTLMDTGKKHGDGTPVQQIKWFESIAGELGIK